jgi:hypothetical protein
MLKVLGIDPAYAKPIAWSFIVFGSCPAKPALLHMEEGSFLDFNEYLDSICGNYTPDLVIIEDQYMKYNYDTSKKLSWVSGKVMGAAEVRGIDWTIANVASWKSKLLGGSSGKYKMTPIDAAGEIWKNIKFTDDLACSALIAYYGGLNRLI